MPNDTVISTVVPGPVKETLRQLAEGHNTTLSKLMREIILSGMSLTTDGTPLFLSWSVQESGDSPRE
jgi:hypothetical protein